MENAYRTLVLRFNLETLDAEKVSILLEVQEAFRQWAAKWVLDRSLPLPERNPLRHFAKEFIYAGRMLDRLKNVKKNGVEVKKMRLPLFFSAQLRLEKEHDISNGILVDLPSRQIRIRKWSGQRGNTIKLPLPESAVKWILERVREGAKLVLAAVWIGLGKKSSDVKLHVALIFRREVVPVRVKRSLIIDFNALHNGLSWAVVEGDKIITKGMLRPDVSRFLRLQRGAARLDSLCAQRDEVCDEASAAKSRMWRLLRSWEDEAAKKLVHLALQYKATIVVDMPFDKSIRELKQGHYPATRKIMLNFGRLRRRIRGMAEWYGMPYREERLYSTICPRCGRKMEELPNRRVRCACGFEANRDEVPFHWAIKRFSELTSFSSIVMA